MRRLMIRLSCAPVLAAGITVVAAAGLTTHPLAGATQAVAPQATAAASPSASWTDVEIESFLLRARVVKTRPAGKGVTDSIRATMTDGVVTHDAHIQTVEQHKNVFQTKAGVELNFRDTWQFNVAAYRLDRLIGLNMVPVSVERRWSGDLASYTWWVDDVLTDEEGRIKKNLSAPDAVAWYEQIHHIRLFDQLIRNMDRNQGNMLITTDWRIWAIDHTRAFRTGKDLRNPSYIRRIDRQVLERLKALDRDGLRKGLGPFLRDEEIDGVLARRDVIVQLLEGIGPPAVFDRVR